jgi:hypothetical protein
MEQDKKQSRISGSITPSGRIGILLAKALAPCHTAVARSLDNQNMKKSRSLAVCLFALAASGCVSVQSYVETGHDKADFRELIPRNPPTPVQVVVDFRVNGQPHPDVNTAVFSEVVRVLQRTRVLQPVSGDPGLTLHVLVNDVSDVDSDKTSSWWTGFTFGQIGNTTRDDYHFNYTLQDSKGGKPQTGLYQHAMITVVGRAAPPSYGQPHSMDEAFFIIVKQSVLEYLHDFQGIDPSTPVMLVPDTTAPTVDGQ